MPKFHCEFNPIERVWAQSKKHSRASCDHLLKGLEKNIARTSMRLDPRRKCF